ncbi:tRNA uridine-5-carboxymethylaminomethyl(34) synthesis GTPase MnmE [Sphingosinicella terrae]|uniref:tRNA uridine-5-carboxymethylaminomethyl(34) synthesis GTPase MnmE n=1 Tax=Sphingosinicella terrae TaxID=2172047 RepID=UPI000E0CD9EE|nr:tRNA uridine-5-carboxymethylaminomethyl(34) synthesis GTPase MnmE [Sphingosinicella terrae]
MSDTVYALSSGAPPAAIAVVRISGPKAGEALAALAGRLPEPRRARLASLRHDGELLDQALILYFRGPASETGEDVAELQLHGGRAVVAAVLAALGTMPGLRPAEPGEFTRRAFENGRIDLSGAEGLADLLFSETQNQRRSALALASGGLVRQVETWQARILAISAQVEALLDFSDEGDVGEAWPDLADLAAVAEEWRSWLARPPAERLREGVRVVIAGPPNAGKSSLLNALAGRDVAITSEVAGTTRDVVEAPTAIAGTPFLLVDTAGLRESPDLIESMGVDRARRTLEAADIILWLGDAEECPDRERAIMVHSKLDLLPSSGEADIAVSSVTGEGLDRLTGLLLERSRALLPGEGEIAINARHRAVLTEALAHVRDALGATDLLILAEALRLARRAIDKLTGRAGVEQMLDALFGRFCVGK